MLCTTNMRTGMPAWYVRGIAILWNADPLATDPLGKRTVEAGFFVVGPLHHTQVAK